MKRRLLNLEMKRKIRRRLLLLIKWKNLFLMKKINLQCDLTKDDLVKLVVEKEEFLKLKEEEREKMKDKILRTYAEMENVKERTKRESENTEKFAIQNFAKSLLDVADI